jgi:two-component system phosphate regulon sensor histidine kinase PhoR
MKGFFGRLLNSRFENIRREFTANVSHELKTPLQSVVGAAELLKSGVVKEEDRERFLDVILVESKRMSRLVGDIIAISQLDDGAVFDADDVDFIKVTRDAVEAVRPAAEKAGVTLTLSTPLKSKARIRGSAHFLDAIVSNLTVNAVHYNKKGGFADVRLEYLDECARLTVSDTGIGIAKEHQSRIFERFYRVDKSRSRETGGTGLGLSIVRNAVRLHKGEIALESVPGEGSTVTVSLPYSS